MKHRQEPQRSGQLRGLDGRRREQVVNAFRELHTAWLSAGKRQDMNEAMDALAVSLGLDPLTLRRQANARICCDTDNP